MSFIKMNEYPLIEYGVVLEEYRHDKTGAVHYHVRTDREDFQFQIGFTTLPENDTGVAHVLEHCVLAGSKHYPGLDLMGASKGYNFESDFNAYTSATSTLYIMGSLLKEGYFNMMRVVLDAVYYPELKHEIFMQEGIRYEVDEDGEISPNGVVFNEMIGAKNTGQDDVYYRAIRGARNHSIYKVESGGVPAHIMQLTYDNMLAFHDKYYHPSNTTMVSVGNLSAEEVHVVVDPVLNEFEAGTRYHVPDGEFVEGLVEGTFMGPAANVRVTSRFEADAGEHAAYLNIIAALIMSGSIGFPVWLTNKNVPMSVEGLEALLYEGINMTLMTSSSELEGDAQLALFCDYISYLKEVSQEEWESVMSAFVSHLKLSNILKREKVSFNNYLCNLISQCFTSDRMAILTEGWTIDLMAEKLMNKSVVNSILDAFFVAGKRFIGIFRGDPEFKNKFYADLQSRMEEFISSNVEEHAETWKDEYKKWLHYSPSKVSEVPKVDLATVALKPRKQLKSTHFVHKNVDGYFFETSLNEEVVYFELRVPISNQSATFLKKYSVMNNLLLSMPFKGTSVSETAKIVEQHLNTLRVHTDIFQSETGMVVEQVFSATVFRKDFKETLALVQRLRSDVDFHQKEVAVQLLEDEISAYYDDVVDDLHGVIQSVAQIPWDMESQIDYVINYEIIDLLHSLSRRYQPNELDTVYKVLSTTKPLLVIQAKGAMSLLDDSLACFESQTVVKKKAYPFKLRNFSLPEYVSEISVDQVGHAVGVFQTVAGDDPRYPYMMVYAAYLSHWMHTKLREESGAYSAAAGYDAATGMFKLITYRDPSVLKSLDLFVGKEWLDVPYDPVLWDACKRQVLASALAPKSDKLLATSQLYNLRGCPTRYLRLFEKRDMILNMDYSEVVDFIKTFADQDWSLAHTGMTSLLHHP